MAKAAGAEALPLGDLAAVAALAAVKAAAVSPRKRPECLADCRRYKGDGKNPRNPKPKTREENGEKREEQQKKEEENPNTSFLAHKKRRPYRLRL